MIVDDFYLLVLLISSINGQTNIRIGIVDDLILPFDQSTINVSLFNRTVCYQQQFNFQFIPIKMSPLWFDFDEKLETELREIDVYLTRTDRLRTKFLRNYADQTNRLFLSMESSSADQCLKTMNSSSTDHSIMPDILPIAMNYLKHARIRKLVYIYDHHQGKHRVYQLLQYINTDQYFNNFSLEIRTIHDTDIYSLLFNIETHSFSKERFSRYIILDLPSYDEYENMFEKLSHMGLINDLYSYIIFSTFDVCLWLNKVNFTGRVIYFDNQAQHCLTDSLLSSNFTASDQFKTPRTYYRSTISFRSDFDQPKPSNITENSSTWNRCFAALNETSLYLSLDELHSKFPSTSHLYLRPLVDRLNLLIRYLTSNLIDCKTLRLKPTKKTWIPCSFSDVNVYSIRKFSTKTTKSPVELLGRYSTTNNLYQSCEEQINPSVSVSQSSTSSRVYYITSLFDEPFLMLRKRTPLQMKYNTMHGNLRELAGRVFTFQQLEGYCVDLAEKICSLLNITCLFRIVQDGHFGSKNASTGIWNGMVGEIVSRQAEMAIAPLTISQKRMEVVDFSKPFMNLGISIMIRKPDAQKPGVFSFMNPVSMEIWFCFSLAYVAVSVILFLTSRMVNSGWRRRVVRRPSYRSFSYPKSVNDRRKSEIHLQRQRCGSSFSDPSFPPGFPPKGSIRHRSNHPTRSNQQQQNESRADKKRHDPSKKNNVHVFGIANALFFSFASFMRQSINLVPKSLSGRIAATSWWYFSLIFVSSYTANLVAFLTVEKLVTPIENVEDLAKQQEIKYGALRNGTTAAFFEKSNVSVFQNMWIVMQRNSLDVFVASNDDGVRKVRDAKGKYAFFIESTKNEYVNERLPCDTMKVGSDLDSKGYGIATRLGSDLSEAVNIIVTNLRESGFLDKLKQRWWYERSECSLGNKDKRFSELSLSSVTGLFYIFLFGIILSCSIAFMEFLITAKEESKELNLTFREILRVKMIENMVGITIGAQRQLEFGRVDSECQYQYSEEQEIILQDRTPNPFEKSQSDV